MHYLHVVRSMVFLNIIMLNKIICLRMVNAWTYCAAIRIDIQIKIDYRFENKF